MLKADDTPVVPGSDEVGEIVASGDNITLGYWRDGDETARYFRRGKLYTGDLARVDAEGFIFIVEREREMIKSGGNRVSAKEVEDVIAEIPAVVEVAVVGVPHELLGEAIKAFVVLTPLCIHQRRRYHRTLQAAAAKLQMPGKPSKFLDALPHTSAGKVAKRKLKEMIPRKRVEARL